MKRFVTIFSFCFSIFYLNAQSSNWKVIDTPEKSNIALQYESSDGTIIGSIITTDALFLSRDNGKSWTSLTLPQELSDPSYLYYRQDAAGNIYVYESFSSVIFKLEGNQFKVFKELGFFDTIDDFKFLPNGNYLIASSEWLKLFDPTGKEINTRAWDVYDAVILPSNIQTKHYVLVSSWTSFDDYLYTFDDNLVFDSTATLLSQSFFDVSRNQDRIFSDNEYSDDKGVTWKIMPALGFFGEVVVGIDGKLYSLDDDQLLISTDNGNNFTGFALPHPTDLVSANQLNRIMIGGLNCFNGISSISNDGAVSWTKLNTPAPSVDMFAFTANLNENIFTKGCDEVYLKESPLANWSTAKIPNAEVYALSDFKALSNNEVIIYDSENEKLFSSKDAGKSWNVLFDKGLNTFYDPIFVEKKNVLFSQEPYSIGYSTNFGKSWIINDTIDYSYRSLTKMSSNLNFYEFDRFEYWFTVRNLTNYNVSDTIEMAPILNGRYFRDYETTFSGDTIIVLSADYDFNDNYNLELIKSFDKGKTFTSSFVKQNVPASDNEYQDLYIDHNGNMVITNLKDKILLSKDFGKTWQDISPNLPNKLFAINDVNVSYDNYLYVSTNGAGLLKYQEPLKTATADLAVETLFLSPNPTNGLVYFNAELVQPDATISIYDVCGKLTLTERPASSNSIDFTTYQSGIYFVKVQTGQQTYVGKIIKI